MFSYSVTQSPFCKTYIETTTSAFKSIYNMGSVAVYEACDGIGLVAEHIFESVSFNHVCAIVTVTTTEISLLSVKPCVRFGSR